MRSGFVFYPKSPRLLDADACGRACAGCCRRGSRRSACSSMRRARSIRARRRRGRVSTCAVSRRRGAARLRMRERARAALPYWRAVRMREAGRFASNRVRPVRAAPRRLLLDALAPGYGGSGQGFDWSLVPRERPRRRSSCRAGWHRTTSATAIAQRAPGGGRRLERHPVGRSDPRVKDARRMERFVAAVLRPTRHDQRPATMKPYDLPDASGHFGPYGGIFVAETLMHALDELRDAYANAIATTRSSSPSSTTNSSTSSAGPARSTTRRRWSRACSAARRSTSSAKT